MKKYLIASFLLSISAASAYPSRELVEVPNSPSKQTCPLEGYRPPTDAMGGYIYGEWLFWRVLEGETDYAVKGGPITLPPNQVAMNAIGNLEVAEYDWSSGFRLGAGWRFTPYRWELEGNYTYYSADGSNAASRPALQSLNSTTPESTSTGLARARSHIDLSYQMGNLLLAKKFLLDKYLIMRYLFGVTGGWLEQDWKIHYFGIVPPTTGRNNITHISWSFWNIGLRTGLEGEWYLGKGFGLASTFTAALLYGQYKNHFRDEVFSLSEPPFNVQNLHSSEKRLVPHFQISFGPKYGKMFDAWGFSLYALYELNIFQNLHYVYRHQGGNLGDGRTNLHTNSLTGLHGLTAGAEVNF
ncbi:MAG: Lpg1974 family pore-forming outer membrane protein [Simkaniaceae bacterium]